MATVQPLKNVQAEELKKQNSLPDPPATRCNWDQAMLYFELLTDVQWENVESYVYRVKPVIDRQLSDPTNYKYIDKIEGKFDRAHILSQHGGGLYSIQIKDRSKVNKQLMEVKLSIPLSEADPIIDPRELDLNNRENKAYVSKLIAEGKITPEGKPVLPNQPPQNESAAITKEFLNVIAKMNESQQRQILEKYASKDELGGTVGVILIEQMKQNNPNSMFTPFIELLKSQKSTASDFTPMLTFMGTMMTENAKLQAEARKESLELMKLLMQNKEKPEKDDEEGLGGGSFLDKMKTMIELAGMIKGGKTPERTGWDVAEGVIDRIGPTLLQTVNGVLGFMTANKQAQTNGGVAGGGLPNMSLPAIPSPSVAPTGTPSRTADLYRGDTPRVVEMPIPAAQQPTQQPQPTGQQTMEQQLAGLVKQFGPLILERMKNNIDGADFAVSLVQLYGNQIHMLVAKHEDEVIITAAKMVPEFWNQIITIYGEPYFRQWINDFKNYEKILSQDQEESEEGEDNAN